MGIVGPGGQGKSALTLQFISMQQQHKPTETLFHKLEPDASLALTLKTLLGYMGIIPGTQTSNSVTTRSYADSLLNLLVSSCAQMLGWLILDDLHHLPEIEAEQLVTTCLLYLRPCKLVYTSRRRSRKPELIGVELPLGPMPRTDLLALAHRLSPFLPPQLSIPQVAQCSRQN